MVYGGLNRVPKCNVCAIGAATKKGPHWGPSPEFFAMAIVERRGRSDRFLQLLGGAKCNLLARLDLDWSAGRGIAAHARWPLAHL